MARNQLRSRRPLAPQPDRVDKRALDSEAPYKLRRAGKDRRVPNPIALPRYLYGFLAEVEGEHPGPWYLSFECTDWKWFNDTLHDHLPPNYDHARLRQILNGRDYPTAWAHSIADRVVLRAIYEHYLEAISERPPPLSLYHVAIDDEQVEGFGLHHPSGGAGPELAVGYWYGLELIAVNYEMSPDLGVLLEDNRETGEFDPPQFYRLESLRNLRWRPYKPAAMAWDIFHSQATLLALHYARGD